MFSGHIGVAFAAKRATPRVSLATLVLAAQWLDVLWPIFLLLGVEHVRIDPGRTRLTPLDFYDYPWTHSAVIAAAWGVAFPRGGSGAERHEKSGWSSSISWSGGSFGRCSFFSASRS